MRINVKAQLLMISYSFFHPPDGVITKTDCVLLIIHCVLPRFWELLEVRWTQRGPSPKHGHQGKLPEDSEDTARTARVQANTPFPRVGCEVRQPGGMEREEGKGMEGGGENRLRKQ